MTLPSDAGEPSDQDELDLGTPLSALIGEIVEAQRARHAELVQGAQSAMGHAARQALGVNQPLIGDVARQALGVNQPLIGDLARQAAEAHRASIASIIRDPAWSVSGVPSVFVEGKLPGIERFASISLQPLLRSVKGVSKEYSATVSRRIGQINTEALERHPEVADLATALDRDDAVEQLVASESLQAVVEDVVESDAVADLIVNVDQDALQEDANEVLDRATGLVAALDGLKTGQIVTIFTVFDILVISTVLQVHGHNLGGVSGIVGLTLSPLAVYGFLNLISKNDK